jgi:hypothetical protein
LAHGNLPSQYPDDLRRCRHASCHRVLCSSAPSKKRGKARAEIVKMLQGFGCEQVGFMDNFDDCSVLLGFTHRGRQVQLRASARGWAAMYLKKNPWSSQRRVSRPPARISSSTYFWAIYCAGFGARMSGIWRSCGPRSTAAAMIWRWSGGAPGERIPPLGEKIARHTKPNAMLEKADRPAHRVIPKSRFAKLETIDAVIEKLIGV